MFPEIVKLVSGVVPPTALLNVTPLVPADRFSACPPFTVLLKLISPVPAPVPDVVSMDPAVSMTGPLKAISAAFVVILLPSWMFPVPPLTVSVTAPPLWAPPVVSSAALRMIEPVLVWTPPGSLAVKLREPPLVVIEALTVMLFPAWAVIPKPLLALPDASIAFVTRMSFLACSVTFVVLRAVTIVAGSIPVQFVLAKPAQFAF